MKTYTVKEYPEVWRRRIKALRKSTRSDNYKAAHYMLNLSKIYAPRKTGATINSIVARRIRDGGYRVESYVPGFKQNLFANRMGRYRKLVFKETSKQPFFKTPQTVTYGGSNISPSGKPIKWTGKPGFWNLAANKTKNRFKNLRIQNVKRALKKE